MSAIPNVERRESGPAHLDRASEKFEGYESERTERDLSDRFAMAVDNGDANSLCGWSMVTDYDLCRKLHLASDAAFKPKRAQTLAECMAESLDYGNGPTMTEAMQLFLNVANGCDGSTQQQARDLLARMGQAFARANS